jgi:hypothetical protein
VKFGENFEAHPSFLIGFVLALDLLGVFILVGLHKTCFAGGIDHAFLLAMLLLAS